MAVECQGTLIIWPMINGWRGGLILLGQGFDSDFDHFFFRRLAVLIREMSTLIEFRFLKGVKRKL